MSRTNATARTVVRALGYRRLSTSRQGASGRGMEAQASAIRRACEERSWDLAEIIEDVASAKSTNGRHGLARARDRLARGEADVLVVAKLDRLARSTLDFATIVDEAQRAGWRLVVLDPALDLDSPFGRAFAGILAVMAQLERDMISERTRVALTAAKGRGIRMGRPEKDRITASTLARIQALRADGLSYRAIAARLDSNGVPTAQGAAKWSAETIRKAHLSNM